jgi:LemA protein
MTLSSGIAAALVAVLALWMLGAYNRVVALRTPIIAAWGHIDGLLQAREQTLAALLVVVAPALDAERAALEALQQARSSVGRAADAVRPRPAAAEPVQALAQAEAALAPALARLIALAEQQSELRESTVVAQALAALQELGMRWQFARQVFNDAGGDYNAAVSQFPTHLLSGLFHFGRAGQL